MSLKKLRKQRGLTLKELSKATGYAKSTIGNFENGATEASDDFLKKMSDFFCVPQSQIKIGQEEIQTDGAGGIDWKARAIKAETKLAAIRRLLDG